MQCPVCLAGLDEKAALGHKLLISSWMLPVAWPTSSTMVGEGGTSPANLPRDRFFHEGSQPWNKRALWPFSCQGPD